MKPCIIFNPAARGDKARRFREQVAAFAPECALKPTTGPGAGRALAAEAVREGFQTIVAAGGDGTLNEVLNGIGDAEGGFKRARLGVLPLGTVNVFAKELSIPSNVNRAWQVIQAGRELAIDLAAAAFTEGGIPVRRYFAQMAGAGWDARAVELVNWEHKKQFGPLAYVFSGIKAMNGPLPQVVASNGSDAVAGELVLIGNGRFYGGRFVLFPGASLNDGVLDATVFPKVNWDVVLRAGWNVVTGQFPGAGKTLHLRGKTIHVSSPVQAPFHVEGENSGYLPVTFSVEPGALRVVVP